MSTLATRPWIYNPVLIFRWRLNTKRALIPYFLHLTSTKGTDTTCERCIMASSLEGSDNNKCEPPIQDLHGTSNFRRDGRFYYPDGSTVFSVDGVLFKLQASLIFGSKFKNPRLDDYDGNNSVYPMYIEDLSPTEAVGLNDDNPLVLPHITARQFRNFLSMVLGLPDDKEYVELLTDFRYPDTCEPYRLIQYLDIACLSRRFGRFGLEDWARKALHPILVKSKYRLASGPWDKDTLLQLRSFTRSTFEYSSESLEIPAITFINHFVSTSIKATDVGDTTAAAGLDACVQLYTDPILRNYDPPLFGCVFAAILSLGFRSWDRYLTGKHRTVLYTTQVQVTTLSELDSLDWFLRPPTVARLLLTYYFMICDPCKQRFTDMWNTIFGPYQNLKSNPNSALNGFLAQLPQCRRSMVHRWEEYRLSSKSAHDRGGGLFGFAFSSGSSTCIHPDGCPLNDELLTDIDQHIQQVYEELAGQYDRLASASDA